MYGSLITKELKKKHSSRLVGVAEMGSWGREDAQQGVGLGGQGGSWESGNSQIHVQISQEEEVESKTECTTQGSSVGK